MMSRQDHNEDDILRGYINPGMIEKAPDSLTSRIMEKIESEAVPSYSIRSLLSRHRVPVISFIVTASLVAAALLLPGGAANPAANPGANPFFNILGSIAALFSDIRISPLPQLNLPEWTIYAFIGVLLLALFDKALTGIFYRHNR